MRSEETKEGGGKKLVRKEIGRERVCVRRMGKESRTESLDKADGESIHDGPTASVEG